jgi:endogenous inhibitor of DNA gyrase (YacG/DUF329 family)
MNTIQNLTCPQCQQQFEFIPTNNRRKYCSIKCKRQANQVLEDAESRKRYVNSPKGKATNKRKHKRYKQSDKGQADYKSRLNQKRLHTLITRKPCLSCLKPIPVGSQKFCSRECQHFNSMLFKLPKNVMARKCQECNFDSYFRQRYCSSKCRSKAHRRTETYKLNKRAGSRRRRARKRNVHNETVYLEVIAKRDKYKCHICRKRVNMDLDNTNKYSPTMDHLIPISLGGDHTYTNIRLAHRTCNSSKGNRAVNEQLLLFG